MYRDNLIEKEVHYADRDSMIYMKTEDDDSVGMEAG